MNDNVEKLKKQAMEIYVYTDYYGDKDCVLRLNEEKFAELIAKEILNISDEVITLSDSPEWLICEKLGVNHDWRRQDNFWS